MTELRAWTDAEVSELRKLWRLGVRVSDIGQALDRTVHSVRRQAQRLGLGRRRTSKLKPFKTRPERRAAPVREEPPNAGNKDDDHIAHCLAEGGFFISPLAREVARETFNPRKAA